ncbi:unnamed protein product [Nesidiocoris tenuis]|uniref:Uncharacterized protein n=1 Tax=Nesidiocoris tenuis TaxID=355587 RepID=A0A6H5GL60_9HEMI|nr:unnamed protein product [Nesidiocoris tenuis]
MIILSLFRSRDNQVPGVIMGSQSLNASLLVEAALESAEKELGSRPEIQSPPALPKSLPSPPSGTFRYDDASHPAFPRLPASSILSVENLTDSPTLAHDDKRPPSPALLPVYDSGLRQCTPPVPSPPHVTYLSPRYDRHYLSPPPPSDYLPEEQRRYND